MEAACASNFRSLLLVRLSSKNHVMDSVRFNNLVKSTGLRVNRKQRFMVMSMSSISYDMPQSGRLSCARCTPNSDRSGCDGEDQEEKVFDRILKLVKEVEFGRILKFDEVMKETEARGVILPLEMIEAAKSTGIRKLFLLRYLDMQGLGWGIGFAMRSSSILRNQMLIDPLYLFKRGAELAGNITAIVIIAIVMKRSGRESSAIVRYLLTGPVAHVMVKARRARSEQQTSQGFMGRVEYANGSGPPLNSTFEAERSNLFRVGAFEFGLKLVVDSMIHYMVCLILYGNRFVFYEEFQTPKKIPLENDANVLYRHTP